MKRQRRSRQRLSFEQRKISGVVTGVGVRRTVWEHGESAKGETQRLWVFFYRAKRGRGGDDWGNGHQWPKGAPAALLPSSGGA
jgi:hypothetical protein